MGYLSKKRVAIGVAVVLVLAAIITPIVYFSVKNARAPSPTPTPGQEWRPPPGGSAERLECHPEAGDGSRPPSKEECQRRNCLWYPDGGDGRPRCFFPAQGQGFTVTGEESTPLGLRLRLDRRGRGPHGGDFPRVLLDVEMRHNDVLRFKFDVPGSTRFQVPLQMALPSTRARDPKYEFVVTDRMTFTFQVKRKDTGKVLLDTGLGGLVLADQFLQLVTRLPSGNVYGLGENRHRSFRHQPNLTWPLWSRDQPPGWGDKANLYGVHPFYTCVEDHTGNTHGVLLLNSNAQDYTISSEPSLTFRTIGGVLDFYVFMGPSPEQVVQQYTQAVGRPVMPPYWALGFQLCRYGYNHINNLKMAVENTRKYNIPHDVQYADIDHMKEQKDFTVDDVNFPGLNDYFQQLRAGGMHTIIILDPCLLAEDDTYEPYTRMRDAKAFITWSRDVEAPPDAVGVDRAILGYVWPNGKVVFPDFFKNATQRVWRDLIVQHRSTLVFDGLWIDMNEPANFGTNEAKPWNWPPGKAPWSLKCPPSHWDDPPYRTKAAYVHDGAGEARLSDKTLCLSAVQGQQDQYRHYDVHSLYGWSQTQPTLEAAREATGERSIVISRSTFPGSGKYAGHWLGDNESEWPHLHESIIGMLEFNLFGIPYIGADICGFFNDTTPELCARWMQLGAFYPFSRNHNGEKNKPQDPGAFNDVVGEMSREAMETRYWLLPYLYTLFHHAHTRGGTVIRPLHHEFASDERTYDIDRQFLWGPALLISPILEQNQTTLQYYLPDALWYDFYHHTPSLGPLYVNATVHARSRPALHVRGGHVIPMQAPANNTQFSRKKPLSLLVALDHGESATGELFWDDGSSVDTFEKGQYYLARYRVSKNSLHVTVEKNDVAEVAANNLHYDVIRVLGVKDTVTRVVMEGSRGHHVSFNYTNKVLTLYSQTAFPLASSFTAHWGSFSDDDLARVDCFPERLGGALTPDEDKCSRRQCTYSPSGHPDIPTCYFPTSGQGYRVTSQNMLSPSAMSVSLARVGRGPFEQDIDPVTFVIESRGDVIHFQFTDPGMQRYRVPLTLDLPDGAETNVTDYFRVTNNETFSFQIIRPSTQTVLWDTSVGGLVLSDRFLQIATRLPASGHVYGFGENDHPRFRHETWFQTYPMFSRDQAEGDWPNFNNRYGVHPFYTCVEDQAGNSHGVLLLNSNAQDYTFSPGPMLTYRTVGGVLDFYLFLGPSPEQVVQQYTQAVGRPFMPAYWSLGFQLSRYGYNQLHQLQAAVARTRQAGIPQDGQMLDIDHLEGNKIFTVDHTNFPQLTRYVHDLRQQGIRTFLLLDPCLVSNVSGYAPYERMRDVGGAIMWPRSGYSPPRDSSDSTGALLGYVWPKGKVVFVDFFKNQSRQVWKELIRDYRKGFPFHGILIDMNEPANFGTNEERPFNWPEDARPYWSLQCPRSKWDDPPYRTRAAYNQDRGDHRGRLSDKTVCLAALQGENGQYRHYDVHSLYGWSQTQPTLEALQAATGERGLLISRSTFVGSGHYTGHWLGDNRSRWKDLKQSVIGVLEFGLFGIPYIGADICGFFEDTTPELCKRWMQLGAFYTFSRNHNGLGFRDQDPGVFDADTVAAMRVAMETRYWLLPYLYTLFHHAHTRGGTVIRPLHHEFPTDAHALGEDEQFLWGAGLLVSPILAEKQQWLSVYLPEGRWYDFYTGVAVTTTGKESRTLPIYPNSSIPLHVRGGHVIPMQEPALNTELSRKRPLRLLVPLHELDVQGGKAAGELFWDDGLTVGAYEKKEYFLASFSADQTSVSMRVLHNTLAEVNDLHVRWLEVWGVAADVRNVVLLESGRRLNFTHDNRSQILRIVDDLPLGQPFTLIWSSAREQHFRRIDCLPEAAGGVVVANESTCQARGCSWDARDFGGGVPQCYFPSDQGGYKTNGNRTETTMGFRQKLEVRSSQTNLFGPSEVTLDFEVQELDNNLLRLSLKPQGSPETAVPPVPLHLPSSRATAPRYDVILTSRDPFTFQVVRRSTGTVVWDTSVGGLQYRAQFLQLATRLPTGHVFGLGENLHRRFQHDLWFQSWPMWSRDQWTRDQGHSNHYGVHPFYVAMETDGQAHGVLFFNSHAQDYSFTPLPMLVYRTIGGILDFFFFLGPDPESVVQQYTQLVGRPYMPPYWALGFQLCKYGYNSLAALQAAVNRTREAAIPHDVQYADIDHMEERKDFTVDPVNFAGLPDYFRSLQADGMKTIIILDPCLVTNASGYQPYQRLAHINGAIMWPSDVTPPPNSTDRTGAVLGYVWPRGKVVFPDFFKNATRELWIDLVAKHHSTVPFDGLWIDMNEPANFGTNEERPFNWPEDARPYWSLQCPNSKWDDPPYRTRAAYNWDGNGREARLSDKTVCLAALQGENGQYRHYDVHSLYGWSQTQPTLEGARKATGKRSVVISRSTFPGSGQHAGHWLGDNASFWSNMAQSIIGLLEFNLFGIPYIGADICGFFEDTTPELCKRWMQLGAFYTFSRNHAHEDSKPQDPGALGQDVAKASRVAMETRYWLLPYLYTLFHHAHTRGGTVIRPLHHEFPTDKMTYSIDRQFLWGASLLISPILEEGQTSLTWYAPGGRWFDFYTGAVATEKGGSFLHRPVTPDSPIPLHVRAGVVLPLQRPANNTHYSRQQNFRLVVALEEVDNRGARAEGELFWDDGDSIDTYERGKFYWAYYEARNGRLEIHVQHNNSAASLTSVHVQDVEVWGVPTWVNYVAVNGVKHTWFLYHKDTQKLEIKGLSLPMLEDAVIEWSATVQHTVEESERVDCLPDRDAFPNAQVECHRRQCIWEPASNSLNTPWCHVDRRRYGYRELRRREAETELQWRGLSAMFQGDVEKISFLVDPINENVLHFKLLDPATARYEVPVPLTLRRSSQTPRQYRVQQVDHPQFGFSFSVLRTDTNTTLWDTSLGGLTFADQFLQVVTRLPSRNVYGLGENRHLTLRHDFNFRRWPMFSRDQPPGAGDYGNLYGVHPFYMCLEEDGRAHAVLLLNSNAMEVVLQPAPALTFRTVGGLLDFYMFLGPSPEAVIQQYTEVIGHPFLPPYWALGFQLCKYGYNSLAALQAAVNRTVSYDIPLDVQYADIDHMEEQKDFTIDNQTFHGLPQYVQELDAKGIQFIIILDPALNSEEEDYAPYQLGLENSTYITWPEGMSPDFSTHNNSYMLGYVWPRGKVVFPDFFKNATRRLWADLIVQHRDVINFDGLWIDMNEPANFDTNKEKPWNWPQELPPWNLHCPASQWDDPPYKPRSIYGSRLSDKTLCMVGLQLDGKYRHYDVHSLYGWSQTQPTLEGLQRATGKRGVVISRSTYPGSGRHAGHWLGDNTAQWSHLHDSILGIIEFNLFGIPYIGADICGYFADAEEEMCERWMQLGSFYTFSRNHNGLDYRPQDPGVWGQRVASSSRHALRIRYSLLPHLYTLFYLAHTRGGTVLRSLASEFPQDARCLDVDTQFLWGSGFMIAPVLDPGRLRVSVYFPGARWFDFHTGGEVKVKRARMWVDAPRDTIPLFVRGGHILPTQDPANNTRHSRVNPMGLLVTPNEADSAFGSLFWDDGDSIDTVEKGEYYLADFRYSNRNLTLTVTKNHQSVTALRMDHVTVLGVTSKPAGVLVGSGSVSSDRWKYDSRRKVLRIGGLNHPISANFWVTWT